MLSGEAGMSTKQKNRRTVSYVAGRSAGRLSRARACPDCARRAQTGVANGEGKAQSVTTNAGDRQPIPDHPLASVLGKYRDDPAWDEVQEFIREYREELKRDYE